MFTSWLLAGCGAPAPAAEPTDGSVATAPSENASSAPSAVSAAPAPPAPSESPEPPRGASVALAANAPATSASAPTARPWPGVDCDDAAAASNLRIIACMQDCDVGIAQGCETLGELHAAEAALGEPIYSAGPAASAWSRACTLGAVSACARRDALLARLAAECKKGPPSACVIEGRTVAELGGEGRREQADALFEKACKRGDAGGCYERAELHGQWEPLEEHLPIADELYLLACQRGSAEGCCSVIATYEAAGNHRAAAHVAKQASNLSGAGFGCGHGGPIVSRPVPEATARLGPTKLPKDRVAALVRDLSMRARRCQPSASEEQRSRGFDVALTLSADAAGSVSAVAIAKPEEAAGLQRCFSHVLHAFPLGAELASSDVEVRVHYDAEAR